MTTTPYLKPVDIELTYDIIPTSLGALVLAITSRGLRFIKHYDTVPGARIDTLLKLTSAKRDAEKLRPYVEAVLSYLKGETKDLHIDLDIEGGTELQRKVWEELQRIPYGTTISYSDLAARVEKPGAVRAVASACGKNPLPLVIPCHRVVAKDGGLGGFTWGVDKKEALLDMEHEGEA